MAETIFRNFTHGMANQKELFERLMKGADIDKHPEIKIKQRIDKLNH